MTADQVGVDRLPGGDETPIAGFWRRLAAFFVDCLILGIPALLLGLAFFRWAVSLGPAGRLIGFIPALIYFGMLNSRLAGGQTLGQRLFDIRVVDRSGNGLSPVRSILRFLVWGIPYFLNDFMFELDAGPVGLPEYLIGMLLFFVVVGGLGAIVYLFVFNRRTRQSLQDLAVGSFVVRGSPAAIPMGLVTPRLHLIVVGCWLTLALVGPGIALWLAHDTNAVASSAPQGTLQTAIKERHGVAHVLVTAGRKIIATTQTGTSTTSFLQVVVQPAQADMDLDALLPAVAGTVLELRPDLYGKQVLIVQIRHGFDFGVARWSRNLQEAHDAAGWRDRLARVRARPGNI